MAVSPHAVHPVRLVVGDDLRRSRLTVAFRWLLAIPHAFWLTGWAILAVLAGAVSFVATLALGRTPEALHRFLAAYVRYMVHLYAYLHLAADPYPGFSGKAGSYPVDVEIDSPARQNRLKVAFRLVLAAPALMLAYGFVGDGRLSGSGGSYGLGVIGVTALLAWFACLATGRMPRGFRDLVAYALRYVAQATAYVLLLTDRYPDSDTGLPVDAPSVHPVALRGDGDLRRSRLSVLFRSLLVLPHAVWYVLWSIAVVPVLPVQWLALLLTGRPIRPLHGFLSAFLRYTTHVGAFAYVVAGPFPGFTGRRAYPVDVALPEPAPQARWKTALRPVLVVPAGVVAGALGWLLLLVAVFGWFAALVLGRMPLGLCRLGAYVLRYNAQVAAYGPLLLTDRYPHSSPAADAPAGHRASPGRLPAA